MQAAPVRANTTSKWLLLLEGGKITTHTSLTADPAVGFGETSDLTSGPAHQLKLLRENTGKMPYSSVLLVFGKYVV